MKAEDEPADGKGLQRPSIDTSAIDATLFSPTEPRNALRRTRSNQQYANIGLSEPSPVLLPDGLLDTFFARVHGKPYYILDEPTTRQRHQLGQLPPCLLMAIYAVSAR